MDMIYFIIKMITFPGTVVKAFLEQVACKMYDIPVEFPNYIARNQLCGHIEHELVTGKGSFGVCFIPHILTLLCGLVTVFPGAYQILYLSNYDVVSFILLYIGIALLTNIFPLMEDATQMKDCLLGPDSKAKTYSKVLLYIPAQIMYWGSRLEYMGITFLTSIGFAFAVPYIAAACM